MLVKLSKYHNDWVRMVKSLGGGAFSEDVVQDMYLKVYNNKNVLNDKDRVNKYYIYLVLKSILLDGFRKDSKISNVEIKDYTFIQDDCTLDEQESFNDISLKIDKQIDGWHWYDRDLFELYRHSGLSIRKIAKETGISWVSIFHTLKNCKGKIKEELENDYKKYKEQDYE